MNLRTKLALVYLLFIFISNNIRSNTPDWVNTVSYPDTYKINENEISNGYLYLLYDNQVNIDAQHDYLHYAIKITNTTGLSSASTIEVSYDKNYQSLKYHYIRIIRDNEVVNVLASQQPETIRRETRLENGIIDGRLTSFLEINDLRVGDIIEYAYTITGFNPIKDGLFHNACNLNYYIPVSQSYLMFQTKEPSLYKYQLINDAPEPEVKKRGELTQYIWNIDTPKVIDTEADAPSWFDPYNRVIFASKVSWEELAQHILRHYQSSQSMSAEINSFLASIDKGNSQAQKAGKIIQHVQDNIRYLGNENGIYSFKPRHPNEIFNKRSGDCKEKSWLLSSMLNEIGIEAYPALVNTYLEEKVNTQPPSYESFDHCITCMVIEQDTLFIDPTISGQSTNLENYLTPDYGYALIIDDETTGLTRINSNVFYETKITENYTIDDYSGNAELHVTTIYKGYDAVINRDYLKNSALNDVQDQYLQFYASIYPEIDTIKLLRVSDDLDKNIIEVNEYYNIKNLWTKEDTLQNKITAYFEASSFNSQISRTVYPERKSPMWQRFPLRYRQEIQINLPEEWTISKSKSSIHGPGFNYYYNVFKKDKTIYLSYDYQTTDEIVNANDYQEFIAKNEKVANDLSYEIYKYGQQDGSSSSGGTNVQMIMIAVFTIIISIYLAGKLYKLDSPNPFSNRMGRTIGGWLVLVAFGVTLTPFILGYSIYSMEYFNSLNFEHVFNPSSDQYSVSLAAFIIVEMIFNLLFFVFSILNVVLFYQRRSIFPKVFIAYILTNFLFIIIDNVVAMSFNMEAFDSETNIELFRRLIYICIWVPYLLISERSKETFVKQLKPNPIPAQPID